MNRTGFESNCHACMCFHKSSFNEQLGQANTVNLTIFRGVQGK